MHASSDRDYVLVFDLETRNQAVAGRRGRAELVERVGVLLVRRMRTDELDDRAREDRDEDEQEDEPERGQRDLVPAQSAPEQRER